MTPSAGASPPTPPGAPLTHDHAWRRVEQDPGQPELLGSYRCDLCPAEWSL